LKKKHAVSPSSTTLSKGLFSSLLKNFDVLILGFFGLVTNNLIEVLEGKINLEVNYNTTNPRCLL
jgi:hypothetical protein